MTEVRMTKYADFFKGETLLKDVPDFPSDMLQILWELAIISVEQFYSSYCTVPDIWKESYPDFNFEFWMPKLKELIPQETFDKWEEIRKLNLPCSTGCILEGDE